MLEPPPSSSVFHDRTQPGIGCTLDKTALGLTVHLFRSNTGINPATTEFTDETFHCSTGHIVRLVHYIIDNRPDITRRIQRGETVSILAPQADPPIIKITRRSTHSGYFTLGELWRWRFLKHLPVYPFKPHQAVGAQWLRRRPVAVLADDMGLGKTLQAIAALESTQRAGDIGNALIVCPKSLIGVWEAELSLWAPRLCVVALHSSVEPREWRRLAVQCHVAVTNYEAIRQSPPAATSFDLVIFDEIQRLKNPKALNYRAAYELRPPFVWGLSGTPLENHAGDLAAILHMMDRRRVAQSDRHLPAPSFRALAARYVLRRAKNVLSNELPEVIEKTEFLPLSPEQRNAYDRARRDQSISSLGAWIACFTKLRDICDYDPETKKSSKIDRASTIINAIKAIGEKIVVFSWRLEPLRLLRQVVSKQHGANAAALITGQIDSVARARLVASFQTDNVPFVLLCSTRATAEGLTLTAANHVLFLNEWWNPAVNTQARDRVNRIGQRRNVYVYRLRCQGTIESRLDELLASKSALFADIVGRLARADTGAAGAVPAELAALLT